ncbi:hypothetical protein [Flammeovirga pacifica]|uniref:TonB C-terminal domain-containing protein n=1 Tax=Flammeovirga pacifica TaxID=915059 RepID=A0A1S1YU04_FLAPC|nr:hypothetical protein [Flammeovirga pacifica]OHX64498.1 hypothetical protein NH26_23250 [Flammeovirga pacifica]
MKLQKLAILTIFLALMITVNVFAQQTNHTLYYETKYMANETKKETPYMRKFQLEGDTVTALLIKNHVLHSKSIVYPFKKIKKAVDFYRNPSKEKYADKSYDYIRYYNDNKIVENGSFVKGKKKVAQITMEGKEVLSNGSGILDYINKSDQTKYHTIYKNNIPLSKETILTSGDTLMWIKNPDQSSRAMHEGGLRTFYEKVQEEVKHSDFVIKKTTKVYLTFIVDRNGKVKKDPRHEYTDVELYIYNKVVRVSHWKPQMLNNHAYASSMILPITFIE